MPYGISLRARGTYSVAMNSGQRRTRRAEAAIAIALYAAAVSAP
jgi:hypothetical protein